MKTRRGEWRWNVIIVVAIVTTFWGEGFGVVQVGIDGLELWDARW